MMLELLKAELSGVGVDADILDLGDQQWLTDTSGRMLVQESTDGFQVRLLNHDLGNFGLYPSVILLQEMLRR